MKVRVLSIEYDVATVYIYVIYSTLVYLKMWKWNVTSAESCLA
jgi:hypothetical protein